MELNGRPVAPAELAALALVNYGHFTSMLVESGRVRGLSLHLDRLVEDCRVVFDSALDPDRIRALIRRLDLPQRAMVRVTVFAPELRLAEPARTVRPDLLVSTRPAVVGPLPPLRLLSAAYQRELPAVKHVGLFGPVLHRRAAQRAGADDVLFLDAASRVCEGATWNIGFVDRSGRVVWPAADHLAGVTMRLLDRAGAGPGPGPDRRPLGIGDAHGMRAAFVTNAAVGVRPVASLDGVGYPPDSVVVDGLRERYAAIPGEPL